MNSTLPITLLCREALTLFRNARVHGSQVHSFDASRFQIAQQGTSYSIQSPRQFGILFFISQRWSEMSLIELNEKFLSDAALALALSIPLSVAPAHKELENPHGVLASHVEMFDGIQMRAVITYYPVDKKDGPESGSRALDGEPLVLQDFYNIEFDTLERRVCGMLCRLDVVFLEGSGLSAR